MSMNIYIHELNDQIICHNIVSVGFASQGTEGVQQFGAKLKENII